MTTTKTPRRTGEELEEAIRQAVREELLARGYVGMSFEGVARRAKTSKTVIYRRYSSISEMVIDAWMDITPVDLPIKQQDSLRGDLLELAKSMSNRFDGLGIDNLRYLLADVNTSVRQELRTRIRAIAESHMHTILRAAQARGEIPTVKLSPHVALLPLTLMGHELMFVGTLEEETIVDLIDNVCLPLITGNLPR